LSGDQEPLNLPSARHILHAERMNFFARTRNRAVVAALTAALTLLSLTGGLSTPDLQSIGAGSVVGFIMRDGVICKYGPGGWC
jgi:hypothetical protein